MRDPAPERLLTRATPADARALLELRERTAVHLARQHGRKRRPSRATIRSVLWELKRGDAICSSRTRIQFMLPRIVLISPL